MVVRQKDVGGESLLRREGEWISVNPHRAHHPDQDGAVASLYGGFAPSGQARLVVRIRMSPQRELACETTVSNAGFSAFRVSWYDRYTVQVEGEAGVRYFVVGTSPVDPAACVLGSSSSPPQLAEPFVSPGPHDRDSQYR